MMGKHEKPAVTVPIQFDAFQDFQLNAINSVVDLFAGQDLAATPFEVFPEHKSSFISEYGVGNSLTIAEQQIAENLKKIQADNEIPGSFSGLTGEGELASMNFSIEMETGTGKTYVYLRTIFELHRKYGWSKFVIVVPSVAIREGVEANLRLLKTHFAELYEGLRPDAWVYDSKAPNRLREFAQADSLQILIMNIDAFNKKDINKIFQSQDQMMGHAPIDMLRATQPILILDEPQSIDRTPTAQAAIASLNPLMTLRYSATHADRHHLLYRLSPSDAYNLGLVKQIEVWSVLEDEDLNKPHLQLIEIKPGKTFFSARFELDCSTPQGVKRKKVTVRSDRAVDLEEVTGRSYYRGYVISEMRQEVVDFDNGVSIALGQTLGTSREEIQRGQIRVAVAQHLERELDIATRAANGQLAPTKVLSLFFIDKVANYWPASGKFRRWFEEEYTKESLKPKYAHLNLPSAEVVHDGYFAKDAKGGAKDSKEGGSTNADSEAYELIMREKGRLLALDEPLRFIFSHSALREGWDNPNVFVITTLADSRSDMKKRQEIGRGMRLPVTSSGFRCADRDVARLSIIANESYEDFAKKLQTEIEEETGTTFTRSLVKAGRNRETVQLRKGYDADPDFVALWERIRHRTTYRVHYDTADLIEKASKRLAAAPKPDRAYIRARKTTIVRMADEIPNDGSSKTVMVGEIEGAKAPTEVRASYPIPDLISHLTAVLPVSRSTIAEILIKSGRLAEVSLNPQQFIDQATFAVRAELAELLVDGIEYTRQQGSSGADYEMRLFEDKPLSGYLDRLAADGSVMQQGNIHRLSGSNSVYRSVVVDSSLEREIAEELDGRPDVKVFLKLPGWFEVATPVGRYNPDWALVKVDGDGVERCYFVAESKPNRDLQTGRSEERWKVEFGQRHFDALAAEFKDLRFEVVDAPHQL